MMRPQFLVAPLLVIAVAIHASAVLAQAPGPSDQDRREFLAYPLTMARADQLLAAAGDMTRYMASRPDVAEVVTRSMKMTRAEQIAQMERDPRAMAIAGQHGLTAREYVYGVPTLRMALNAAQGQSGPTVIASPANIAFAKANLATLKPKMDAVDRIGARR